MNHNSHETLMLYFYLQNQHITTFSQWQNNHELFLRLLIFFLVLDGSFFKRFTLRDLYTVVLFLLGLPDNSIKSLSLLVNDSSDVSFFLDFGMNTLPLLPFTFRYTEFSKFSSFKISWLQFISSMSFLFSNATWVVINCDLIKSMCSVAGEMLSNNFCTQFSITNKPLVSSLFFSIPKVTLLMPQNVFVNFLRLGTTNTGICLRMVWSIICCTMSLGCTSLDINTQLKAFCSKLFVTSLIPRIKPWLKQLSHILNLWSLIEKIWLYKTKFEPAKRISKTDKRNKIKS